jgi:hypothetical protein
LKEGELKKRTTPSNRGCDTKFSTQGKGCYFICADDDLWVDVNGVHRTIDEAKKEFEAIVDSNYRSTKCSEEYYSFWNELANLVQKWFGGDE